MRRSVIMKSAFVLAIVVPTIFTVNYAHRENSNMNTKWLSLDSTEKNVSDYRTNEQGMTYGHGPYPTGLSQEPDLIQAVGEDGIVGYVKASDMDPSFSTPTEAISFQESKKLTEFKTIPMYESNGKTIIGEFKFYYSD